MTSLGPQMDRLANTLDETVALIETHGNALLGDERHSKRAAADAQSLREEDVHGAEHFLSGFQDIDEFDDVVLLGANADKRMRELFDLALTEWRRTPSLPERPPTRTGPRGGKNTNATRHKPPVQPHIIVEAMDNHRRSST